MQGRIQIQWKGINTLNNFQYNGQKDIYREKKRVHWLLLYYCSVLMKYSIIFRTRFPMFILFSASFGKKKLLLRIAAIPLGLHCEY